MSSYQTRVPLQLTQVALLPLQRPQARDSSLHQLLQNMGRTPFVGLLLAYVTDSRICAASPIQIA